MAGRDHEEKRQFRRIQMSSQLQFRRADSTALFKAETLDLSATGVRFRTSAPVNSGEHLQIVINSQHPQIAPLVAEGRVIRSETSAETVKQYEISVLFTELR